MISDKQKEEWCENPVTIELHKLINKEIVELVSNPIAGCLKYGNPHLSHENLVKQDVRVHTLATCQLALEGDWDYFEETEDEE